MSFENEMKAGFAEMDAFAGEAFTMSNHAGTFRGVFAGDDSPTAFDDIQGFDTTVTNAMSVSKSLFIAGSPPMVNELITKPNGDRYTITGINQVDDSTWDIILSKRDA